MGAYGCVMESCEYIRMQTDAYGCIWMIYVCIRAHAPPHVPGPWGTGAVEDRRRARGGGSGGTMGILEASTGVQYVPMIAVQGLVSPRCLSFALFLDNVSAHSVSGMDRLG